MNNFELPKPKENKMIDNLALADFLGKSIVIVAGAIVALLLSHHKGTDVAPSKQAKTKIMKSMP